MKKKISNDAIQLNQIIGKEVRSQRLKAGITQVNLAKELGISKGTINHIENGIHSTALIHLYRMSLLFKVEVGTFFP